LGLIGFSVGCKKPQAKSLSIWKPEAEAPRGPLVAASGQAGSCSPAYPYPGTNALYLDNNPPGSASSPRAPCAAKSAVLLSGTITDVPEFTESMADSRPSPNYSSREGVRISQIVVHHTNGWVDSAVSTLRSPAARVSAHLLVARDGKVVRLVSDEMKAWHAVDANRNALGVEIEALEQSKGLTPPQERMLLSVLRYWSKKHSISTEMIKGHRSVVATLCPSWIWPNEGDLSAWLTNAAPFLR
jgi:hypothetical protein